MIFVKRMIGALMAGLLFFLSVVVIIVVFGYILADLKGLKYIFHDALVQGVHSGLYLGTVIAVLAFVGTPRRRPPF